MDTLNLIWLQFPNVTSPIDYGSKCTPVVCWSFLKGEKHMLQYGSKCTPLPRCSLVLREKHRLFRWLHMGTGTIRADFDHGPRLPRWARCGATAWRGIGTREFSLRRWCDGAKKLAIFGTCGAKNSTVRNLGTSKEHPVLAPEWLSVSMAEWLAGRFP